MLALAIAVAFAAVTAAGVSPGDAQRWIAGAGPVGPVVFVLAGGVLGLALFPGHVTATIAGVLFGALAGTVLALAAALLGAGLCLLAARYLGADAVGSLLGTRGQRWRSWVTAHGFGAVLASRLAPGVPAGMVNYLGGLAGIAPRAFLAAVALGALPEDRRLRRAGRRAGRSALHPRRACRALYVGAAAGGALVARSLVRSA